MILRSRPKSMMSCAGGLSLVEALSLMRKHLVSIVLSNLVLEKIDKDA